MEQFNFQVLKNKKVAGRYTDPAVKGLHLWVKLNLNKYWVFRFSHQGKQQNMSLGVFPATTINEARQKALQARNELKNGVNPLHTKKASKAPLISKKITFMEFAKACVEMKRPEWRNEKHAAQWTYSLETFAYPIIGNKSLDQIDTEDILKILTPIWKDKTETASRLRGRLEWILASAATRGFRTGINPALWRGHLQTILPAPKKTTRTIHHKALPYRILPQFMAQLREMDGMGALALEFLILNASRTGEVIGGLKKEVSGDIWTIPESRMKAFKEHQVALCSRSIDILTITQSLDPDSPYLFSRNGKPISNMAMSMMIRRLGLDVTVHGFRSCFRDWVSEETNHSHEVAEMALAHTISNKVEKAYRRGNLLERRRQLLQEWQDYCFSKAVSNVLELKSA
jgi:integrase